VEDEPVLREGEMRDDWADLIEALHRGKGSAFILGASDTGKSTLAHLLVVQLCRMGNLVALIDGDIGQSVLGPPTTIGLGLFDSAPRQLEDVQPLASYFVGSTSPRGHMLDMLVGIKRIADRLKYQKVDLLRPAHLIGLQRRREIESLLKCLQFRPDMAIHRLGIHEKVRVKSPEQRRSNRTRKFAAYFREVKLYEKNLDGIKVVSPFKFRHRGRDLNGVLIGLNDEANFNLGIGILESLDVHRGTISFLAPELDVAQIRLIRIGSLEVDLFGNDRIHHT
jgi:polynucleotide 5'-hydroxyl-kinase GRC3/NOL9